MNRRAFFLWAIIALLWANLPYLVGYASSTSNNRFSGFFLYEQDGYSYLAKMRQGAHGAWTFHLPYTSEDEYQAGGVAYLFYLIAGKIGDSPLVYHTARLLSSIFLLIVLRRFITRFVRDGRSHCGRGGCCCSAAAGACWSVTSSIQNTSPTN